MSASVDMTMFITPKSDQLNADDLIGGPRTITVTKVYANQGSAEQPVSISFDGDNGKPYKPCKSMRRVLVHIWGSDARNYVGRSMTLYCDPSVQFGGMKVGGIRISHMSHIDKEQTMALTATRAKRAPYTVHPLKAEPSAPTAADYESCRDQSTFDALEKRRAEAWKTMPPSAAKNALKAAADAAKSRLAAGAAAAQTNVQADLVGDQRQPYTADSAIAALRACEDDGTRANVWKDVQRDFEAAGKEVPLDVEAVNQETKERFAL